MTDDRAPPRERPIIFSGPMVRAILAGRKTQTRRILKPQPKIICATTGLDTPVNQQRFMDDALDNHPDICPHGIPGDRLWIRETFAFINNSDYGGPSYYEYRADTDGKSFPGNWPSDTQHDPERPRWKPAIHMPRAASRTTLEIEAVRVEGLQDIPPGDIPEEGVNCPIGFLDYDDTTEFAHQQFRELWESINGNGSWDANPWVWVLTFKRIAP